MLFLVLDRTPLINAKCPIIGNADRFYSNRHWEILRRIDQHWSTMISIRGIFDQCLDFDRFYFQTPDHTSISRFCLSSLSWCNCSVSWRTWCSKSWILRSRLDPCHELLATIKQNIYFSIGRHSSYQGCPQVGAGWFLHLPYHII